MDRKMFGSAGGLSSSSIRMRTASSATKDGTMIGLTGGLSSSCIRRRTASSATKTPSTSFTVDRTMFGAAAGAAGGHSIQAGPGTTGCGWGRREPIWLSWFSSSLMRLLRAAFLLSKRCSTMIVSVSRGTQVNVYMLKPYGAF